MANSKRFSSSASRRLKKDGGKTAKKIRASTAGRTVPESARRRRPGG